MKKFEIDRRTVLRGAAGAALALPFLEIMRPSKAQAQSATGPKRFLLFFHHQGMVMGQWRPTGTETNFTLPYLLEPLAPHQSRIIVVHGVGNGAADMLASGNDHEKARTNLLTGGDYGTGQPWEYMADRISIDQELAQRIGASHPFRSINLAIGTEDGSATNVRSGILHYGPNDPVSSTADPTVAFNQVFGGFSPSGQEPPESIALRTRRTSVLDLVKDSFDRLKGRVGAEDRTRLEAHAEKIRQLELRLTAPPPVNQCSPPSMTLPSGYEHWRDDNVSAPIEIDLMVMALACDRTRVGSIYFANGHNPRFPWMTYNGGPILQPGYDTWHTMVHQGQHEPALLQGFRFYSESFALLLRRLNEVSDEDGPLLDSTYVLWISDFGDGSIHNRNNLAIVLAGNVGVSTGRFIDHPGMNYWNTSPHDTTQLYTSILNAFGFPDSSFGRPGLPTGPLAGL